MRDLHTLIGERAERIAKDLAEEKITLPERILLEAGRIWLAIGRALPEFGRLDDADLALELLRTFLDDPDEPSRIDDADLHFAMAGILRTLYPERTFGEWKRLIDALP